MLRSEKNLDCYRIKAEDGILGKVRGFLFDECSWLPGKDILAVPDWIKQISWSDSEVTLTVSREQVNDSPEFDPSAPVNREYEIRFYDYYGRPRYWMDDVKT